MRELPKSFFNQNTLKIAKNLLGNFLISKTPQGTTIGRIIETEAYLKNDPASHAFKGKTQRNSPMFDKPGTIYVYFTYGMHFCFNIVTEKQGIAEAVLIRALEPISGTKLMQKRRKLKDISDVRYLCNGPAKLVEAMGISPKLNGRSIFSGPISICVPNKQTPFHVLQTPRIGISKGKRLPYRFVLRNIGK
jgi:DNA-3-methyladenine glycosylase